ncbi:aminodeoxychorismate/anthranilate synthase component II [Desulfothermus okinawensis JCM 13304]
MFLLIDNYDSFTYNLVQIFQKLQVNLHVLRNDDKKIFSYLKTPGLKGIVLSPGPGSPASSGLCREVLDRLDKSIPVFGVCLGHQVLGYFAGYSVSRAKKIMHGKTSHVTYKKSPLFDGVENPFIATRYHSLVISNPRIKNPLEVDVIARSEDGEIMAIAFKDRPWFGVQFHPESVLSKSGPKIIENFLKIALQGGKNEN